MTVHFADGTLERISAHGETEYPDEAAGALLGSVSDNRYCVEEVLQMRNEQADAKNRRFFLSAEQVLEIEKAARRRNLEIIGWYHSHPDHGAVPSEFDKETAWPFYAYPIVSVVQGKAVDVQCWRLRDDESCFERCEIVKAVLS